MTSLNVEVHLPLHGLRATLRGSEEDLDSIESTLSDWARQHSPSGKDGLRLWVRTEPEELEGLAGAFISALGLTQPFRDDVVRHVITASNELVATGLLRKYQGKAVREALLAPWWRSVLDMAPGAGKTYVCAGIQAVGLGLGMERWAYVVLNRELAAQSERKFRELIPGMLGVLGADASLWRCVCGSYGQLKDKITKAEAILVDECHGLAARTRWSVFAKAEQAFFRCGLSGTPLLRQDAGNALVLGLLGPVAYRIAATDLVKLGVLARGNYTLVSVI